ncbi:MAG: pyridoxal-phosphate dependent enzyme [Planctomycetota bacterium]
MIGDSRHERIATLACEAARMLREKLIRTPLVQIPSHLVVAGPDRLLVKLECCQRSGSFKARGATHFLERLLQEGVPAGVLTYSSGNHGRAVAEAAEVLGIPALVVAPGSIDPLKAQAVIDAGAELVRVGPTSDERKQRAEQIAADRGWTIIPPFDHDWIMAGQGTLMLEIIDEIGTVDHLWVPVGGGGLSAGCAAVAAAQIPGCQVHTVEPEGSAALARSIAQGRRLRLESSTSEADGLLPLTIGQRNWEVLSSVGVVAEVIDEDQLLESLRILRCDCQIEAEPSGACSVAPLLVPTTGEALPGGTHVAVISGGNVSDERLERLLRS